MNVKTWIPLGLALVLGLVAAMFARNMMSANRGQQTQAGKFTQVVTVKGGVAPGHEMTAADLTTGQIMAESAPEGTFTNVADVVGRVTTLQLVKGQPVIESLLAPKGAGSGLQALVPEGMRAITVEVNEFSGVAGMLQPGCHVDVLATIQDSQDSDKIARTIVENVRVTAVGPKLSGGATEDKDAQLFKSVTLLAEPKDAEAIELAASCGRPRLVLRGGNDDGSSMTGGVSLAELRGQARSGGKDPFVQQIQYIPVPPPVSPTTQPDKGEEKPQRSEGPKLKYRNVQVIRNGVESTVSFVDPFASQTRITGAQIEN
jgi:pilus assembly protein CpaB